MKGKTGVKKAPPPPAPIVGEIPRPRRKLVLASDLGMLKDDALARLQHAINEVARPLSGLIRSIERS